MTCRHSDPINNPSCGSYRTPEEQVGMAERQIEDLRKKFKIPTSPDSGEFEIEDHLQVGQHLLLKVKYPSCTKCSFEGSKVMVFLNCDVGRVLRWKEVDPHFRDKDPKPDPRRAPSPDARFPATEIGWQHAIEYARIIG